MDDLMTDNPTGTEAANPNGSEPAMDSAGTGQLDGQGLEATPNQADLFRGIDPNKLPPEAKHYYDSMLRDYREKTGKLSETIKAEVARTSDSYRTKAEMYDQIATQEAFVNQWNEYVQKIQQTPTNQVEGDTQLMQMKQQLQEVSQKLEMGELKSITDAFADAMDEKGEKINGDFDKLNSIQLGDFVDESGSKDPYSLLRACVELAQGQTPNERLALGYKMAKQIHNQIFEEGRKAGMGRVQMKLQNSSNPPTGMNGNVSVTETRPKNAKEALDMAKKGIVVSR